MFDRLMVANRGEVVSRIARTARRLGIATVGVYSDPDRNAPHTDAVDTAVSLGGAAPAESYLRGDAIIELALRHGCDALHPGYGFLSENAGFAQAVIDSGLIWVGPTPRWNGQPTGRSRARSGCPGGRPARRRRPCRS